MVLTAFLAAVYSGAYAVVTSISAIGLYISYVIPVILHFCALLQDRARPVAFRRVQQGDKCGSSALGDLPERYSQHGGKQHQTHRTVNIGGYTGLPAVGYGLRERRRFKGPMWTAQPEKRVRARLISRQANAFIINIGDTY